MTPDPDLSRNGKSSSGDGQQQYTGFVLEWPLTEATAQLPARIRLPEGPHLEVIVSALHHYFEQDA